MPPVGTAGLFFARRLPAPADADQRVRLLAAARDFSLPPDKLSASILRFARHFSLPLEPKLLQEVRREALQSRTNREAAALASCASRAKGLPLDQAALELYAAAVDPRAEQGHGDGGGRHGGQERRGGKDADGEDECGPRAPATELLRRMNAATDPSGARWVVLPFAFSKNGIDFKASLRLLFNDTVVRRLALDVAWDGKRRTVVVDAGAEGVGTAAMFAAPPLGKIRAGGSLKSLASLLGPLFSKLEVGLEETPLADCLEPFPAPVDEEA